jgi:hypothetical protein
MDPVQIYETTIYNRDRRGEHFSFATVPARSIQGGEVPSVDTLAQTLGVLFMRESPRAFRRNLRPWGLPFLIDGALGRRRSFHIYFDPDTPFGEKEGPSPFAEYLAFEAVVPFESSPLGSKALATLVGATASAGAGLGYAANGDPIVLITVPAGIVVAGVALGIGAGAATGLAEGIRHQLRSVMGLVDDSSPTSTDDE